MQGYIHKVNYYETDKMGIVHHSNYIRFMEEARLNYLEKLGYPLSHLEAEGVTSPVVSVSCEYKYPTTYNDKIEVEVDIEEYTGVKLMLSYIMKNAESGKIVAVASSTHCFINDGGIPIAVKKYFPDLDEILKQQIG